MAPLLVTAYRAATTIAPWLFTRIAAKAHAAQGASAERLPERSGRPTLSRPLGPVIWLHASSVGEVQSASAVIPALAQTGTVLLTTTTTTGRDRAAALVGDSTIHQYQPIDTPGAITRFLDHWAPDLVVFTESETPPNTLRILQQRGIPRALIGARPSRSRRRFPAAARHLLGQFDLITAAAPEVGGELASLGLSVAIVEDIKRASFAALQANPPDWPTHQLARPIWLAASTHAEDLPIVFDAHMRLIDMQPDALLLLAPRHPGNEHATLPPTFTATFHSEGATPVDETQVFVMDAIGQMPALHAAASACFLGGSFGEQGGHSPWEAAAAGNAIATGPHVSNNAPAFAAVEHETVTSGADLADWVMRIWGNPTATTNTGDYTAAQTIQALTSLMDARPRR